MEVQDQSSLHWPKVGISSQNPLKIGGYSIDIVPKAENMEFELQRIMLIVDFNLASIPLGFEDDDKI